MRARQNSSRRGILSLHTPAKTEAKARPKLKVPLLDLKAQYASIRDEVQRALAEVFESQQFKPGSLLESEEASAEVLSLPVYPELSEKHLAYVAESISEVLAG